MKLVGQHLINYYDLSLEEIEEVLQSMNTRAKKADEYHDEILNWLRKHSDILSSVIYDKIEELARDYPGFTEGTLRNYIRYLRKKHDIPKSKYTRDYEAIEDPPIGQQMQINMGEKWVYKADEITRVKMYLIAFLLSHSRFKYVE